MEYRLLGPLEVIGEDGGPLPLGGAKQRALLAVLLLRPNEAVSTDRLIDEIWGETPPATAAKVVQVYVSQLRKALEAAGGRQVILTVPTGYSIRVEPGELDVDRFERLLSEGRGALVAGDPRRAAELLRDALRLWRGPALADFAFEPFAQAASGRLEELRLAALEERIEADLALGRHAELVGELEALIAAQPLRERPRGQLMLALYRSGRQAEALEAYRRARRTLVDELGIDPGPLLQELEKAVLRQDPALAPPGAEPAVPAGGAVASPARAILVVPRREGGLGPLLALARPLAVSKHRHELLLAEPVTVSDGSCAGEAELERATARLRELRDRLVDGGVAARVAAFTSREPAEDIVRLARHQQVDLVLLDAAAEELEDAVLTDLGAVLDGAPCDVAIVTGAHAKSPGPAHPVLVPFGAAEHDWAALELGSWLARGHEAPLRLLGTAPDDEQGRRDASRLLADASLILQRLVGLVPEPLLVPPGPQGVVEAAEDAGALVVGLSERWRHEGLGATRVEIARGSPAPVLFVRRGMRPSGLAPPEGLTRFAWSLAPVAAPR